MALVYVDSVEWIAVRKDGHKALFNEVVIKGDPAWTKKTMLQFSNDCLDDEDQKFVRIEDSWPSVKAIDQRTEKQWFDEGLVTVRQQKVGKYVSYHEAIESLYHHLQLMMAEPVNNSIVDVRRFSSGVRVLFDPAEYQNFEYLIPYFKNKLEMTWDGNGEGWFLAYSNVLWHTDTMMELAVVPISYSQLIDKATVSKKQQ